MSFNLLVNGSPQHCEVGLESRWLVAFPDDKDREGIGEDEVDGSEDKGFPHQGKEWVRLLWEEYTQCVSL